MESWSYVSGGNGFMSNEAISSSDSFAQRKMPWWAGDSKAPYSFGNNMLVSDQPAIDGQGLGELGYQDLVGKQLPETSTRDVSSSKIDGGKFMSPFGGAPTSFSLEDKSTSRLSSSIVDSNSKESSFIHLQLGRFGDPRDGQSSRISRGPPIVSSSSESSMPLKRAKMGVNSYTAYCQVYGCNKDLSSSKDYHKRHRVCEVHSKTAKVIVNGIEQRFCQQCSRFHLLAEFDDGKRSCRKRLAGHNERRRKPQVGFHSGRTSRLFQIYNGPCAGYESGRFHSPALTATSFICPDILSNGLLHPEKYKTNEWSRSVKVGGGTHFGAISAVPISSGNLPMKLLFPAKNFNEVCPHYHDNGANNTIGNNFSDSTNHFLHMGAPDANSRWLLQDSPLANDKFPAFDAASTMQGQSEITDVGCALSLLSCQSHNSSSHSSGIPLACPMVVPGSYTHYSVTQVSERLMGVNSRTSTNVVSNKFSSQGMSSAEASHLEPMLISDSNEAINFNIIDGMYQGSHFVNARDHLCCEAGATINLLQLSSQLQRVECKKQSMHVKQKRSHAFCFPSIT